MLFMIGNCCFSDVDEIVRQSQMVEDELGSVRKKEVTEGDVVVGDGMIKDGGEPLTSGVTAKKCREFKAPEDDINITNFSKKKFAPQSKRKILWAVNMYSDWRKYRKQQPMPPREIVSADLDVIGSFTKDDLCFSLSRFVREVKKIDGSDYPPNTIRELVLMIQMHLHENEVYWKLLDDPVFLCLCNVVDNTMKERHAQGLGVRKSSEIISLDVENKLFESGILGESSPLQLLRTVIYMLGLHCALRGGIEHNNLRRPGCNSQISLETDKRGKSCMVYWEDPLQKTNQGGLVCKNRNKIVHVYLSSNPIRCPIRLYKKYIGLLPQSMSCRKLYLRCKKRMNPRVWYCDQPYGMNKIKNTVKEICKEAGIDGKYTNHSLRATCASCMYDRQVPEQIIKEVTGHKSDCVHVYKRTSEVLKENASKMVSGETSPKKVKVEVENDVVKEGKNLPKVDVDGNVLSFEQMIENVKKTQMEIRKKLYPKSRLKAKKILNKAKKLTIDLNLNMKVNKQVEVKD